MPIISRGTEPSQARYLMKIGVTSHNEDGMPLHQTLRDKVAHRAVSYIKRVFQARTKVSQQHVRTCPVTMYACGLAGRIASPVFCLTYLCSSGSGRQQNNGVDMKRTIEHDRLHLLFYFS